MRLLLWLVAAILPGIIGAPFTSRAPGYYRRLDTPEWAPPSMVFGPVWSTLYLLIGIAAWTVDRAGGGRGPLALWGVQQVLNATWTPIFFGLRNRGAALVNIVALWFAIVATLVAFWRRRAVSGALLLPYLAWVTFATALTFEIWRRNRE